MTYTWDSDNKLRSAALAANGTADVKFHYDALGRRVARTGTGGSVVFVQMDQQTIADYPVGGAATTPTFRYVYASYIDEPVVRKGPTSTSTVHFYHRNHQYSVTAITTSTGAIAERYAYTAYGQPTIFNASGTPLSPQTSTLNSRYSYTGREWDATLGLHHFRARWMNPSAGRFLGRDPIAYVDGNNLYRSNLGFVKTDPSGSITLTCDCHCWGGGSCGSRESLYPRYDESFQLETENIPPQTGQSSCQAACYAERNRRGYNYGSCNSSWGIKGVVDPSDPLPCSNRACNFNCNTELALCGALSVACYYCTYLTDPRAQAACFTGCGAGTVLACGIKYAF
ncbi:MAG: RHS repeat domain-containing protein [Planctomycetota bacterium]